MVLGVLSMSEKLYLLTPDGILINGTGQVGWYEPNCRFVHTQSELDSDEIQKYVQTPTKYGDNIKICELHIKKWTLDEVLSLPEADGQFRGWTPAYSLEDNGFEEESDIGLAEMCEARRSFNPRWVHDLEKHRDEIEAKLEQVDYQNRELIIFRTTRRGLNNWDNIQIYSIGEYHSGKERFRKNIIRECVKNRKEVEKRREEHERERNKPGYCEPDFVKVLETLTQAMEANPDAYSLVNSDTLNVVTLTIDDESEGT